MGTNNIQHNYRTVFVLNNSIVVIGVLVLLCNSVNLVFGSERTEPPEYFESLRKIAAVRQNHEARLIEVYKNEVYDNTPPKMNIAAEESPNWNDHIDNVYEKAEEGFNQFRNAKPIHDTNSEVELNGTREHLPTNQVVVDAYEGFSNFLNRAIDTPWNFVANGWNAWLKWWDRLGSRLVGLNHDSS